MSSTQLDKRYGNDWAKAKSRDLVREMIQRTLLRFRKPKDLRVLCLPGNEAIEIREVYDPLGIPRENIIGVEIDEEVSNKIKSQKLGIQVVNQSLEDFVAAQNSLNFDVVSLDYSTPLDNEKLWLLDSLCKKQGVEHFVLHHANLIKRDRMSLLLYAIGESYRHRRIGRDRDSAFEEIEKSKHRREEAIRKIEDGKAKEVKLLAYTALLRPMFIGMNSGKLERIFKFQAGSDIEDVLCSIEEEAGKIIGEDISLDRERPINDLVDRFGNRAELTGLFEKRIYSRLEAEFSLLFPKDSWKSNGVPNEVLSALVHADNSRRSFSERDFENYSYISESGAPMIGDIYFLSYPRNVVTKAKEIARAINFPERFKCDDSFLISKLIREYNAARKKFTSIDLTEDLAKRQNERPFLGSSAKPVLTKEIAIDEFRQGASIDQIKEKYRGVNGKPLAAWKAHVTMGTYDRIRSSDPVDELIIDLEDSDLEKITKEEAIDLLSSGIPVEEIYSAYPTSFSRGQLRAYKAHITMKTYE